MVIHFEIISLEFLDSFKSNLKGQKITLFKSEEKGEISLEQFQHYLIQSSLFSSKIEGNSLDINSFFNGKGKRGHPKKKEIQEIEDLVLAYKWAVENPLNQEQFLKIHGLLSPQLLPKKERGKYRNVPVAIRDSESYRPVYLAVEPDFVLEYMDKLFADIQTIKKLEWDKESLLYLASMIHLWLAMIHPFGDGNGRMARLLEKWFLATHLGPHVWSWQTEKFYWNHRERYYREISLGYNFYALNWDRCLPFLSLLPESISSENQINKP